jgi:predicted hydrocarbon binding protein
MADAPPDVSFYGRVKGTILLARLAFVRARGGEHAVHGVLARLPQDDREQLSGLTLAMSWYPFELNVRLDAAIAHELGGDSVYRALGVESASQALSSTFRNFARGRDPHGLLKHVAQIHRMYKDSGYMTYEWADKNVAVLRTFDCKSFSAPDCLTNLGWHERAVELCGGRSARANETQCRARGSRLCEYRVQWLPSVSVPPSGS